MGEEWAGVGARAGRARAGKVRRRGGRGGATREPHPETTCARQEGPGRAWAAGALGLRSERGPSRAPAPAPRRWLEPHGLRDHEERAGARGRRRLRCPRGWTQVHLAAGGGRRGRRRGGTRGGSGVGGLRGGAGGARESGGAWRRGYQGDRGTGSAALVSAEGAAALPVCGRGAGPTGGISCLAGAWPDLRLSPAVPSPGPLPNPNPGPGSGLVSAPGYLHAVRAPREGSRGAGCERGFGPGREVSRRL